MPSKEVLVSRARVAKKLKLYTDLYSCMKAVSQSGEGLNKKERNLFYLAYQQMLRAYRVGWYKLLVITELIDGSRRKMELTREYKELVERQWLEYCSEAIGTIDSILLPRLGGGGAGGGARAKIFYLKMRADLSRYMVDICGGGGGGRKKRLTREAKASYQEALDLAEEKLPPAHPLRLATALNFSVFYGHVLDKKELAIMTAKGAATEGQKALAAAAPQVADKKKLRKVTALVQLLRDNISYWEPNETDEEEINEPILKGELMKEAKGLSLVEEGGASLVEGGGASLLLQDGGGGKQGAYPSPTLVDEFEVDEAETEELLANQIVPVEPYHRPPATAEEEQEMAELSSSTDDDGEEEEGEGEEEEYEEEEGEGAEEEAESDIKNPFRELEGEKTTPRLLAPPNGLQPYEFSPSEDDLLYKRVLREEEKLNELAFTAATTPSKAALLLAATKSQTALALGGKVEKGAGGDEEGEEEEGEKKPAGSSEELSSSDSEGGYGDDDEDGFSDDEYSEEKLVEEILDDYFKFESYKLSSSSGSSSGGGGSSGSSSCGGGAPQDSPRSTTTSTSQAPSSDAEGTSLFPQPPPSLQEEEEFPGEGEEEEEKKADYWWEEELLHDSSDEEKEAEEAEEELRSSDEEQNRHWDEIGRIIEEGRAAAARASIKLEQGEEGEEEEGEGQEESKLPPEEQVSPAVSASAAPMIVTMSKSFKIIGGGRGGEYVGSADEEEPHRHHGLSSSSSSTSSASSLASHSPPPSSSSTTSSSSSSSDSEGEGAEGDSSLRSPLVDGQYFHPLPSGPRSAFERHQYVDEFSQVVAQCENLSQFQFSAERLGVIDRVLEFLEEEEERKATAEAEGREFDELNKQRAVEMTMEVADPLLKLMFTEFRVSFPEYEHDLPVVDEADSLDEDDEKEEEKSSGGSTKEGGEGEGEEEEDEEELTPNEREDRKEIGCLLEFPTQFEEYEKASFEREYIRIPGTEERRKEYGGEWDGEGGGGGGYGFNKYLAFAPAGDLEEGEEEEEAGQVATQKPIAAPTTAATKADLKKKSGQEAAGVGAPTNR